VFITARVFSGRRLMIANNMLRMLEIMGLTIVMICADSLCSVNLAAASLLDDHRLQVR